jgi:hypothetical protein
LEGFALAQANLSLAVNLQHLDHNFVALLEDVAHTSYTAGPELGNVHEAVGAR